MKLKAEWRTLKTGFVSPMNANDCIHRSDDGHLLVSSEGPPRGLQEEEDRDLGNGEQEERR